MRRIIFAAAISFATAQAPPARADDDTKILHSEAGKRTRIAIEERGSSIYKFRRLILNDVLHGSQATLQNHWADHLNCLVAGNPLDNLMNLGAIHAFDVKLEPLTYHHRSGPVGAVYHELRTRKNGADAKAPVAVIGLTAGTQAAYAVRGQKFVFYENDPAIKKLVADTDKYFTYVSDARTRGADVDVRVGNTRAKLKEDKNQKYAAIFVDLSDSFPIPTDIFTKEAVREYFDRLTEDGLLALHISNKYLLLEPMFAKLAEELRLTGVVWYDDAEGRPGKTASSWVVLARKREHLGDKIGSPLSDLVGTHGSGATLIRILRDLYPELVPVLDKSPLKQEDALLEYLDKRTDDERAKRYAALVRKHSAFATAMAVLQAETGYEFRPLGARPDVTAWTDARADVMILCMNPEILAIRRFFGFPTPLSR